VIGPFDLLSYIQFDHVRCRRDFAGRNKVLSVLCTCWLADFTPQLTVAQAFLPALGDRGHDPFFSLENATTWITSRGYQLYLEHDDAQTSLSLWNPDQATPSQLRAYRSFVRRICTLF
jgi:hypothetical protein